MIQPLTTLLAAPRRPESPKNNQEKAERLRTYAPAKFRCHFEEHSFEPRAFGIACGRGLTPVQELEAVPRLVRPQEASEALSCWGTGTPSNADLGHDIWSTRTPCDPVVSVGLACGVCSVDDSKRNQTLDERQVLFRSCGRSDLVSNIVYSRVAGAWLW